MIETNTNLVPVAAAIRQAQAPHRAPARKCPECGNPPPAGMVRCRACRHNHAPWPQ